jgi:hypothetical protein
MELARGLRTHLEPAALGLLDPLRLRADLPDRKLAFARNLDQREPVVGGIDLRRRPGTRRGGEGQRKLASRPGLRLRRVGEAVTAREDRVLGVRKIRQHVPSRIVGHDHLPVPGAQLGGLGNDPRAGLRPARAGDDAADVVGVDGDLGALRAPGEREYEDDRKAGREPGAGNCPHQCLLPDSR